MCSAFVPPRRKDRIDFRTGLDDKFLWIENPNRTKTHTAPYTIPILLLRTVHNIIRTCDIVGIMICSGRRYVPIYTRIIIILRWLCVFVFRNLQCARATIRIAYVSFFAVLRSRRTGDASFKSSGLLARVGFARRASPVVSHSSAAAANTIRLQFFYSSVTCCA